MTERNGGRHTGQNTGRRLTVAQAADALGVTVDAIRSRIKRDSIAHVREGGRVYVVLGGDQGTTSRDQGSAQHADQSPEAGPGPRDELVEELRNRVRHLEEESRRKDHIIMTMAQRIPELLPPATAPAPRDAAQTFAEEPEGSEPRPAAGGTQKTAARRSWIHRFFFGP